MKTLILATLFAANVANAASIPVIIQTNGDAAALAGSVTALGGIVTHRYVNVPAVAATIPVDAVGQVRAIAGVSFVQKDHVILAHDLFTEGKNGAQPSSFVVTPAGNANLQPLPSEGLAPEGYAGFLYTGAAAVWSTTGYGAGSVVAVVDTGTVPNVCIGHAVIGAPGFPNGFNATGDGIAATDPMNHYHGTHVGGAIASMCALETDPADPLARAVAATLGWTADFIPIYGQAPLAQLYPVKVFAADGAGSPTSVILAGLDHVLTLKKSGALDVDIVNMSLGGPTFFDGHDTFDRFVRELDNAGILVVTSAGNAGPIPNTVGSPATSFDSVSVGALDRGPSSAAFYEWLGLTVGADGMPQSGDEVPGMGATMRPTWETRVVNFSSRGPTTDGRSGPDIVALGHWTFYAGPMNELRWASGTSFSGPTVAGGAALLNAYLEANGSETDPRALRDVLLAGANPQVVAPAWRDPRAQGEGTMDIIRSLTLLASGDWDQGYRTQVGKLDATVLSRPKKGRVDTWLSDTITVGAGESFDAVLEIGDPTSRVTIEVMEIVTADNSAVAYWPNALETHVQSAKRTGWDDPVAVYWYPHLYGDAFDLVIEDGDWTFWGMPWANQPMEPGLMKISLIGDYSNGAPVSFRVRITREDGRMPTGELVAAGPIAMGGTDLRPVYIPDGVGTATFDLDWHRKWDAWPSADVDLIVINPTFTEFNFDGATGNAPERAVVDAPAPGWWYLYVSGYEMYTGDRYEVHLTLE